MAVQAVLARVAAETAVSAAVTKATSGNDRSDRSVDVAQHDDQLVDSNVRAEEPAEDRESMQAQLSTLVAPSITEKINWDRERTSEVAANAAAASV